VPSAGEGVIFKRSAGGGAFDPGTRALYSRGVRTWAGPVLVAFVALGLPAEPAAASPPPDVGAILDGVDDLYRGRSSHGTLTMYVVKSTGTRDLTLEQWSKGADRFSMRILSPEKERGIATLVIANDAWSWFPKVTQVTRLTASMLAAPWMGSHLTNNEIVKRARLARDYTASKSFEGERDGLKVVDITCDAKPEAAVVWSRVVVTVRQSDAVPVKMAYFDEAKRLKQTVTFTNEKTLGGRTLPATIRFVNADKPEELTEVRWNSLQFDVDIPDARFSLRALQR